MNVKRGNSQPKSRRPAKSAPKSRRRLLMESLETRQVMAGGISPDAGVGIIDDVFPRNIGAIGVDAFRFTERELANGRGLNDSFQTAEVVPLGTGTGQRNTVDVTGSLPPAQNLGGLTGTLPEDVDFFAFDLRAGDILDIAGIGAVGGYDVFYSNGQRWFATDTNQAFFYPANSPLMDTGNAVGAQIVPETGRYFLRVAGNGLNSAYTVGLRVYRPAMEQQPIGARQKFFLQFEGATLPLSVFSPGTFGTVRVPALRDSLVFPNVPIQNPDVENLLIDKIMADVRARFSTIATNGTNGNLDATGIAGQYGVEFFNDRDNPGFVPDQFTTRVLVGGALADYQLVGALGVSETIDIGNFRQNETVIVPLDLFGTPANFGAFTPAGVFTFVDVAARALGGIVTHEIGHAIGLRHTNSANLISSVIDAGGSPISFNNLVGAGGNNIIGDNPLLDIVSAFPDRDQFFEVGGGTFFGNQRVAASASWGLATGTLGRGLTGTVFNDLNRDGQITGTGESGVGGVTVFVDRNGNGLLDTGETSTTTAANGTYSLTVGTGTSRIVVVPPPSFSATVGSRTVEVTSNGTSVSNVNFGVSRVAADITGSKWADLNGNGFRDTGEPGIPGVFIYLDLDGDDRIDLGEPRSVTNADGSYTINFPGPGTYTIREVVAPGFTQTFPVGGEHIVVFTGASLGANFNFGNQPTLDFGDAPDTYLTTMAAGGPRHGITAGLSLGGAPDRELDGTPTVLSNGDDVTGFIGGTGTIVDDEDGVVAPARLFPGGTFNFTVNLTNTTGQVGYLQAWFDLNQDGTFSGPGEQVIVNATPANGANQFPVTLPAGFAPGSLYSRFRYSLTPNLPIGGTADTGEVEDHVFNVFASPNLANPDTFSVSRNAQSAVLDVLANDAAATNSNLVITQASGARGVTIIGTDPNTNRPVIFYTPPIGILTQDSFSYTVRDLSTNEVSTARVTVNISSLSNVPIAVDDTFEVSEGSNNIALNVLDNDIASQGGGITIISVTPGSAGGQTSLAGGSQTIRYTPRPGFTGTEEFTYSISDTSGNVSTAKATINLLPGARLDDLVSFTVGFFDAVNTNTPITDVKVGDQFLVRVNVEALRASAFDNPAVFSAFLDLLYSSELVTPLPNTDPTSPFNFDIRFGAQFQSAIESIESGDADTPGLFNEIGSQRPNASFPPAQHEGPVELVTIRMQAVAPGVAVFTSNPADEPINETTLYNRQTAVGVSLLRLGTAELFISPDTALFTSAVDDSFPNGVDSRGIQIQSQVPATFNVAANDLLGPTGVISELAIATLPQRGRAEVGPNNSIIYTPFTADQGGVGFDSFTYTIVTADGVRSTAEVSLTVGNAAANDLMEIALVPVRGDADPVTGRRTPITGNIAAGSIFGVEVVVDDLRGPLAANPLGVFAAFADILYDAGLVETTNDIQNDAFDFDVEFGPDFGVIGAFGVGERAGIIDEFGSFLTNSTPSNNPPNPALTGEPVLLGTIFFRAKSAGTVRFAAGPADSIPLRESLLFQPAEPVPFEFIRYGVSNVTIGGAEPEARHNGLNPSDVNADGMVSPIDALLVINQLSRARMGEGEAVATNVSTRFADVTGDGSVTPLDALRVINAISRSRLAPPIDPNATPPAIVPVQSYRTLEEIKSRRNLLVSQSSAPVAAPAFAADSFVAAPAEDDESDILALLADDVARVWSE